MSAGDELAKAKRLLKAMWPFFDNWCLTWKLDALREEVRAKYDELGIDPDEREDGR